MAEAYRWDLWAAAYLIQGGCSDDGFEYFCDWLISLGKHRFEAALRNPDSLAEVIEDEDDEEGREFEAFAAAVIHVWEIKRARTFWKCPAPLCNGHVGLGLPESVGRITAMNTLSVCFPNSRPDLADPLAKCRLPRKQKNQRARFTAIRVSKEP